MAAAPARRPLNPWLPAAVPLTAGLPGAAMGLRLAWHAGQAAHDGDADGTPASPIVSLAALPAPAWLATVWGRARSEQEQAALFVVKIQVVAWLRKPRGSGRGGTGCFAVPRPQGAGQPFEVCHGQDRKSVV